jgi:hypothetical protein
VIREADRPCENESPMNAAIPERRPPAIEEILGLIERVTFHNDESGFSVLRVKARGQRDETTVIGSVPSVSAGEWLVDPSLRYISWHPVGELTQTFAGELPWMPLNKN